VQITDNSGFGLISMDSECNLRSCAFQKNTKAALLCVLETILFVSSCSFADNGGDKGNGKAETLHNDDDSMEVTGDSPETTLGTYSYKYDPTSLLVERDCVVRSADCTGLYY